MNPTWTIAALTIKEAVRRRLLLAFVTITTIIVGLSAWGFDRLSHTNRITPGESHLAVPDALIVHDAKTSQIHDANQAAVQLYGYTAQELMRLCAHDLGPATAGRQRHRRKGKRFQEAARNTAGCASRV